jgi:2-polyprenyl-6-hydroxyphenyl methylase/3-demethylubiquinone-9 3-methyltransferase
MADATNGAETMTAGSGPGGSGVDPAEVGKFDRMAARWWDPKGPAEPLHKLNPCRLDYVCAQIAAQFDRDRRTPQPFAGLDILDVGCGGGLISEPMARLGATVTGLDAAEAAIAAAQAHARESGLDITYRADTAETLSAEGGAFDAILALEVVEHVPDPAALLVTLSQLLRPGGLVILSTLNRTPASFLKAIVGAEWVMGWLPRGTHDWRRFVTPEELSRMAEAAGLAPVDRMGMAYAPLSDRWSLTPRDLSANYLLTAVRAA